MRSDFVIAILSILSTGIASGQARPINVAPPKVAQQPAVPIAYYAGPGVTAPELFPANLPSTFDGPCKNANGIVVMSAIVDRNGLPFDVNFYHQAGNELDEVALNLVKAEHFKAGTYENAPAPVAVFVEVDLVACEVERQEETGKKRSAHQHQSAPAQLVEIQPAPLPGSPPALNGNSPQSLPGDSPAKDSAGGPVFAPTLIHKASPQYTDAARRANLTGECVLSLTLDTNGIPHDVRLIRSLAPSLDEKAIEAVKQYRFKPAMRDGKTPVPTTFRILVEFQLN